MCALHVQVPASDTCRLLASLFQTMAEVQVR